MNYSKQIWRSKIEIWIFSLAVSRQDPIIDKIYWHQLKYLTLSANTEQICQGWWLNTIHLLKENLLFSSEFDLLLHIHLMNHHHLCTNDSKPFLELAMMENHWYIAYSIFNGEIVFGTQEREREIKFIGLFEDRGHRGPYSPYKPYNHNLYIGTLESN